MGGRVRMGVLVFLMLGLICAGSCRANRACCEPRRVNLLLTGLVGWQQIGDEPHYWQFDNGTLIGRGAPPGNWLATVDQYADFTLSLEFRISPGAEGGLYLRAPLRGDPTYVGTEVQILDDATGDWGDLPANQVTGSLYDVQAPSERMGAEPGRWQQMVVTWRGPRIVVVLNGEKVVDTDVTYYPYLYDRHPGLTRDTGYIGLRAGAGTIEFRNIHIESIP